MAGSITINFKVMKEGQAQLGMKGGCSPIYIPGPVQPQFSPGRMLYFEVRDFFPLFQSPRKSSY
jgi:formamidase